MTTIYLRAATEADMKAALPFAVIDGEWVTIHPRLGH
jgi:hypothetical protein